MVLPGQYLERSVVVGELDALYHRGKREPPCVIASPHPALGGSMIAPVIAELAWALTRAGHATMRFNYRGVNLSEGKYAHGEGELEDARAALAYLRGRYPGLPFTLAGFSFGSRIVLRLDPRLSPRPTVPRLGRLRRPRLARPAHAR